jgi:hypothetical protein
MAFGNATFGDLAGAVGDLFASSADSSKAAGLRIKAQGDLLEGQNYDMAAVLAGQNEKFTEASTAIKQSQLERQATMTIGGQQADIAGAGFANSGTALDLMRDSASQGALTKAVAGEQGLITEAGYTEQQTSYQNLSKAAQFAAAGDEEAAKAADQAATGATITGLIKGAASIASIGLAPFTGGASLAIGGLFMGGGSPSGYGS